MEDLTPEERAAKMMEEAYEHLLTKNYDLKKLTKDEIEYLTYCTLCGNIRGEGQECMTAKEKKILIKLGEII